MKNLFLWMFVFGVYCNASAQMDARLFQYPDISDEHIVFTYGGDLWTVDKMGGIAAKLTTATGTESRAKISPDGSMVSYTANYDGNSDIYTIPIGGGVPKRVTHHGMFDRNLDWMPDAKHLLFASSMYSEKQRFSKFFKIPVEGGLPEKMPMAYGEYISISPDGKMAAFTDKSRLARSWKRYRGGMAADIFLFDLEKLESKNITNNPANDEIPMWIGDKIYYLSDKGSFSRYNLWEYDPGSSNHTQLTEFKDYDVHLPSSGGNSIVFEAGGKLHVYDVETRDLREVEIQVGADMTSIKPRKEKVSDLLQYASIAPDGKRVVASARGDLFSLPTEEGYVQNMSRSSGVAERYPAWAPNGKHIAYWSDKSGEYELHLRDLSQGAKETQITNLGPGFRYRIFWSPDSKKIVWVDQTMTINILDIESKAVDKIDQDLQLFEGGLRGFRVSWSPNSAYVAYDKAQTNGNDAIYFYDVEKKTSTQMTSGFYSTFWPTFDPTGDYLFCYTNNNFDPEYSDFDNTWIYPNATKLAMFTLRDDVESPMKPANDTVAIAADESEEEEKTEEKEEAENEDESEESIAEEDEDDFVIDFEGFSRRMIELPPHAGNVGGLAAVEGKVIFMRTPNTGEHDGDTHLKYFDLEEAEEKTIISDINGFQLSADGSKLLVFKNGSMAAIDVSPGAEMEDMIPTNEMEMTVNPKEEWMQIFNDAWRFQRDFFYDTEMHGVDWPTLKERYGAMIADCSNRADVNFVIGELIGELNASHTYRGGGDQEYAKTINVGYLGVDWTHDGQGFKIDKIIKGADWDTEVRSPLDMPGVAVDEGDYVLAVNGIDMSEFADPYEALEGMAGKTVELTVNSTFSYDGAKKIMIEPLRSETRLRNLAWIEANRKRVDEASGGKIGYIYVPSTGVGGQNELARQFYGQWDKEGLIIDERFNNGGQIPDRFIELLNRKPLAFWDVRDGENWQWPPVANFGSMAMLINGWAGSGGDAFPDYFRKAGLGPLIGTRTWGGLIGISGAPSLIDGGVVTVPTFRMYNPDGTWFKEGHGVDPDIEVPEDPGQLAKGIDTQLERAIQEVMNSISSQPKMKPSPPAKEKRT